MLKHKSFNSWHTGLCLFLYMTTVTGLVVNNYWQHWANDYRTQVELDLWRFTSDANYIFSHATRLWLPLPWEADNTTLRDNIEQLERDIRLKFDEYEADELSHVSWHQFRRLVSQWDARNKICQIANQINLDNSACLNSERFPVAWVNYFEKTFSAFYYMSYVDGRPVFGNRSTRKITFCNPSPIASNFTVLLQLASLELSEFYRVVMQREQPHFEKKKTETLAPGECRQLLGTSYDLPVEAVFHVVPKNPEMEAWFFDNWKRYHAKWLNNSEQFKNLVDYSRQSIATTLCDHFQKSENVDNYRVDIAMLDAKNCRKGKLQTYLYGQNLVSQEGIFFASNYPGFSDYGQYLNGDGILEYPILESILEQARELAPIVEHQFKMSQKWGSRTPRFILGASLGNTSGPLTVGIDASYIPQTTILGDEIDIPQEGVIYEINGQAIYSIHDIYEALEQHGDWKGIMSPVSVNIYNEYGEIQDANYKTRFRFNPFTRQNFDTNVNSGEISVFGAFFKSTTVTCSGKAFISIFFNNFEYDSISQCSWFDDQRYAYARQINPEEFDSSVTVGSVFGLIAIPGALFKGAKYLNGARHMSTLGRVFTAAIIEGGVMGAYAHVEKPASEPLEDRRNRVFEAVKKGILYGSAFALILR